jgi:hypothetical protein
VVSSPAHEEPQSGERIFRRYCGLSIPVLNRIHGLPGLLPKRRVRNFPLLSEEGWLRDQEKIAKASLARADGVVFNLNKFCGM